MQVEYELQFPIQPGTWEILHLQKDLGITRIVENKGVLGTIRDTLLSCAIGAIVLYNTLKQEISTIGTWDY